MSFFTIIFTLMLNYYLPRTQADSLDVLFESYSNKLALSIPENAHAPLWKWILFALLPTILVAVVFYALNSVTAFLGVMFNVLVLYLTLNFNKLIHHSKQVLESLQNHQLDNAQTALSNWTSLDTSLYSEQEIAKKAIEETLVQAHYQWFAPILWFVVSAFFGLGAAGVVLYRLTDFLAANASSGAAATIAHWLNKPVIRLTAWGYAIVGDFEDALYCWREQAASWANYHHGILLSAGAGALEVKLGGNLRIANTRQTRPELGVGEEADVDYLKSAIGLIWRVLVLMVGILLLLTFAYWLGAR